MDPEANPDFFDVTAVPPPNAAAISGAVTGGSRWRAADSISRDRAPWTR